MSTKVNRSAVGAKRQTSSEACLASISPHAITGRLLKWYDGNRRDLPWRRRQGDPYAQWVAEVMLQQTRVETVLRYYEPFLRRFPDVRSLARARYQTVLKCWEGLGYYRRILHMHRAARMLNANGAEIPRAYQALRELPGLGEYTAAAVASIAFNEPVVAIDGNGARVIARLFAIDENIRESRVLQQIRRSADSILPRRRTGDFNQALMDLGAAICTSKSPTCESCPLSQCCTAHLSRRVHEIPHLKRKAKPKRIRIITALLVDKQRVLLRKSGLDDLWPGCWEFPSREMVRGMKTPETLRALATSCGVKLTGDAVPGPLTFHQLTHRSITFVPFVGEARCLGAEQPDHAYRWASQADLARLPISTAHRKVLDAARPLLVRCGVLVAQRGDQKRFRR